jgi:hypothetical protein
MLFNQPLARTAELHPRAVHQQVQGPGIAISAGRLRLRHRHRRRPPAQGGVVRHAQRQTEQANDRADQPLGLPIGKAEHGTQRERGQDR